MATPVDEKGQRVLAFMTKIDNLGRIGDLTREVVDMAESRDWREYTTALGTEKWRAGEFDYFLIAMGVRHEDARSIIAWNDKGAELAPLMDPEADGRNRRPIEQAAAAWQGSGGPESFLARAQRLEWLSKQGSVKPAVSRRALDTLRTGLSNEQRGSQRRKEILEPARRQELDELVEELLVEFRSPDERRYLIDQLRRPKADWYADAEKLEWNASALAEHWNVSRQMAHRRIRKLREAE